MKYKCTFDNGEFNFSADVEKMGLSRTAAKYMFFNIMIDKGLIQVEPNKKNKTYNENFKSYVVVNKYDKDNILIKDKPRKRIQVSVKRFSLRQYNMIERNPFLKIKGA